MFIIIVNIIKYKILVTSLNASVKGLYLCLYSKSNQFRIPTMLEYRKLASWLCGGGVWGVVMRVCINLI